MAKKKWIQESVNKMKKKGTLGSLISYCKSKGFKEVNNSCVNMALKSASAELRKKALWAKNVRKKS